MRFSRPAVHLFLALVLVPAPGSPAQTVAMPDGSRPPTVPLRTAGGGLWTVWSARDDLAPRILPSTEKASGPPLGFLAPCLALAQHKDGVGPEAASWVLVARREFPGTAAGWVDRRDLLTAPGAELDPGSNAPRMVVITNTVLSLQTPGSEEWMNAPIRKSPKANAPRVGSVPMLGLYFRYAGTRGWVLVGPRPRFGPDGSPGTAVAGWVPDDLVVPFDGRFAAAWDRPPTLKGARPRRPASAKIFRSRRDAFGDPGAASALFEEQADEDGAALVLAPDKPRMPILPFPVDDEFPELDPLTNNQLIRLTGLGALLGPGDGPPTRAESARINAELEALTKQLTTTRQVLFVIDDTMSMGPQFPRVAETVRRIIEDALRNRDQTVEVAVSYYDDVNDAPPPGYRTMPLVNAQSDAGRTLLQEVGTHGQRLVSGGDFPEMVAEGLEHALDDARFEAQPKASRLVILIGDHGNRGEPDYDRLVEKLTRPGRVADRAGVGAGRQSRRPPSRRRSGFRRRLEESRAGLPLPDENAGETIEPGVPRRRQTGRLLPFARRRRRGPDRAPRPEVRRDEGPGKRATRGARAPSARTFPTKVGAELEGLLTGRGVPVARLRSLAGVRVGHEGYVWRWFQPPVGGEPGVSQVRIEAWLGRAEAKRLVERLAPALSARDPLGAIRAAAAADPSASFESIVLRPLGLPATALMLRTPVSGLTAELVAADLPSTRLRLGRLQALAADPASGRWFRTAEGDDDHCWVDVQTELP